MKTASEELKNKTFRCYRIFQEDKKFTRKVVTMKISELPACEVIVKVHYSALNYKDALSC